MTNTQTQDVKATVSQILALEKAGCEIIRVAVPDISRTVRAYRLLAPKTNVPFHVGVTEAGGLYAGITKSAIGIGMLLAQGIGALIELIRTSFFVEGV